MCLLHERIDVLVLRPLGIPKVPAFESRVPGCPEHVDRDVLLVRFGAVEQRAACPVFERQADSSGAVAQRRAFQGSNRPDISDQEPAKVDEVRCVVVQGPPVRFLPPVALIRRRGPLARDSDDPPLAQLVAKT